jgi:hypothetical protein
VEQLSNLTKRISLAYGNAISLEREIAPKLLDVYSEIQIEKEIEDISSDLQLMSDVQRDQGLVIGDFLKLMDHSKSSLPAKEDAKSLSSRLVTTVEKPPIAGYDSHSSSSDRARDHTHYDELGQTKKFAAAVYSSSVKKTKWIEDLQESLRYVQRSVSLPDGRHTTACSDVTS